MTDYEKICDLNNIYKAHKVARLGKRSKREVIEFEMNLADNLVSMSEALRAHKYEMSGYYSFKVYDPKERVIHALHYRDRVFQHCLCDEVVAPVIDRKLIYDNAACRIGKGTHFALNRVSSFFHEYYRKYGSDGYILKFDIRKFFDSIDHEVLKNKIGKVFDKEVFELMEMIINGYEIEYGKGLPLGNQTSQWFAVYYLDSLDRLIKEKLRIKYYSRYMDDGVIIHNDKEYLRYCLSVMKDHAENELGIYYNNKTQIFPIKNGVDYIGWHFYLTEKGKVVRKLRNSSRKRFKRNMKRLEFQYSSGVVDLDDVRASVNSYMAHLSHGNTWNLRKSVFSERLFIRNELILNEGQVNK